MTLPVGIGVHFTRDEEVGMEAEGYGGRMRNNGSMRHMLVKDWFNILFLKEDEG